MNVLKQMLKWVNILNGMLGGMLTLLAAIILCVGFISRQIGSPVHLVVEITSYALIGIAYLGFSVCEEKREHVRIEIIFTLVSKRLGKIINIFGLVLTFAVSILLFKSALGEAIQSFVVREMTSGAQLVPVYPAKIIMGVGLFFYSLQILINLYEYYNMPINHDNIEGKI